MVEKAHPDHSCIAVGPHSLTSQVQRETKPAFAESTLFPLEASAMKNLAKLLS